MTGSRIRFLLASLLVGLLGLAGCSQAPRDITAEAAEQLQEGVDAVVQAVVEGRLDGATAELARTRALLEEAADAGQLSVARYRTIDEALLRTEAELALVIAAGVAPPPEEAEEPVTEESADSGGGDSDKGPPDHSNAGGKDR